MITAGGSEDRLHSRQEIGPELRTINEIVVSPVESTLFGKWSWAVSADPPDPPPPPRKGVTNGY